MSTEMASAAVPLARALAQQRPPQAYFAEQNIAPQITRTLDAACPSTQAAPRACASQWLSTVSSRRTRIVMPPSVRWRNRRPAQAWSQPPLGAHNRSSTLVDAMCANSHRDDRMNRNTVSRRLGYRPEDAASARHGTRGFLAVVHFSLRATGKQTTSRFSTQQDGADAEFAADERPAKNKSANAAILIGGDQHRDDGRRTRRQSISGGQASKSALKTSLPAISKAHALCSHFPVSISR